MGDAEVLRRATNLPRKVLEDQALCSKLASRLPTSLPPAALLALKYGAGQKPAPQQMHCEMARGDKPQPAAQPPQPAARPATPLPQLDLPLRRNDSCGSISPPMCPPGMQPVTPRALCRPLGTHPLEPTAGCCKAAAAPAAAAVSGWAPAARRLTLALGLQLALLPLLLATLSAVLGGPAELPDASLGSARTWGMACSCAGTLLLLCTHAAYAKLGWRVGAALDALTLALRAGASRSPALLIPTAAVLLVCRLLLAGCALAPPSSSGKLPKGAPRPAAGLRVQHWQKA